MGIFALVVWAALLVAVWRWVRQGWQATIVQTAIGRSIRSSLPPLGRTLDAGSCVPTGAGIAPYPGHAGQTLTFSLTLVSWQGKPYEAALERALRVEIGGTTTLIASITNHNNGKYDVSYLARKAGTYHITLWANEKKLGNSPYHVRITAGPIDPSHCTVKGPGLGPRAVPSNEDTQIIVSTADSFGNVRGAGGPAAFKLVAKGISNKSGGPWEEDLPADVHDNTDGSYVLTFRPRAGVNEIELTLDDQPVHRWSLNVLKPKQMAVLNTNVEKKRFFFKATHKGSTIWIYVTEKQVALYSYILGIVPRRLQGTRLHRGLKVSIDTGSATDFSIDMEDGQPPLQFASEERNLFWATYCAFVHGEVASKGFEERQQLLFLELRKAGQGTTTQVQVNRAEMLPTLLRLVRTLSINQWKGPWRVTFENEPGYDGGGLLREFFTVMGRAVFRPDAKLFAPLTDEGGACGVHPCARKPQADSKAEEAPKGKGKGKAGQKERRKEKKDGSKRKKFLSGWFGSKADALGEAFVDNNREELLELYKAAGLLLAKTVWDAGVHDSQHLVDVRFTRSFRKQLLGLPPHFTDWQTDDPQFYLSKVKYLLENDPSDLELNFTEEVFDEEGNPAGEIELKAGGKDVAVTEANRTEYLHLLAKYRLQTSVEERIGAFKEGFHSLISEELICMFDENELELLFNGMPTIDLAEFRASVRYSTWREDDEVVRWFWVAVENFNEEERARLLQFITGSSQLPLGGFRALKTPVAINKLYSGTDSLPQAATCFNRLLLPAYSSHHTLAERLLYAITEGSQGFGFA